MRRQRPPSPLEEAVAYLQDALQDGPVPADRALQGAKEAGIALQVLYAAKRALGLSTTTKDGKEWWS